MSNKEETTPVPKKFDHDAYPENTCFYDRREGKDRRDLKPVKVVPAERRDKPERRKRIDPTTFEKQYTPDEIEFMTAMQAFKVRTGKNFPSFGEVIKVAVSLGYRRAVAIGPDEENDSYDRPKLAATV